MPGNEAVSNVRCEGEKDPDRSSAVFTAEIKRNDVRDYQYPEEAQDIGNGKDLFSEIINDIRCTVTVRAHMKPSFYGIPGKSERETVSSTKMIVFHVLGNKA